MSYMEATSPKLPHLIILAGIPGSGKSYFADHFSKSFNAPLVSDEIVRGQLFNKPSFSKSEDILISKIMNLLLTEMLKTNRTIVYKGSAATKSERNEIVRLCKKYGYEPFLVWIQTDSGTAKKRFMKKIGDKSIVSSENFDKKLKRFYPPQQRERPIVISGKHSYESQIKIALSNLMARNPSPNIENKLARDSDRRSYLIK